MLMGTCWPFHPSVTHTFSVSEMQFCTVGHELKLNSPFCLINISRDRLRSCSHTQTNSPIPKRAVVMYEGNEMGGTGRLANTVTITHSNEISGGGGK